MKRYLGRGGCWGDEDHEGREGELSVSAQFDVIGLRCFVGEDSSAPLVARADSLRPPGLSLSLRKTYTFHYITSSPVSTNAGASHMTNSWFS